MDQMNVQDPFAEPKVPIAVTLIAIAMFVVAPIAYAFVAYTVLSHGETIPPPELLWPWGLPVIAAISVMVGVWILPRFLSRERTTEGFLAVFVVRAAMIEAAFVYGLALCFMTQDPQYYIYFVPIAAAGIPFIWPTTSRMKAFLEGKP